MWQDTKHGLFKQYVFDNFDETRGFINECLKIAEKYNFYFRVEIEYKVVQIWMTNNGKIDNSLLTKNIVEELDSISNTSLSNENNNNLINPNSKIDFKVKYLKLYADGGSRGNPGPSSSGFVIFDEEDNIIEQKGVYLGVTTNNQAEYTALKLGLESCLRLGAINIDVYMDSLLVINQMKGIFKIRNKDLWPIHDNIKKIVSKFKKVKFQHIPREMNKLADAEVNKALDNELSNS